MYVKVKCENLNSLCFKKKDFGSEKKLLKKIKKKM